MQLCLTDSSRILAETVRFPHLSGDEEHDQHGIEGLYRKKTEKPNFSLYL